MRTGIFVICLLVCVMSCGANVAIMPDGRGTLTVGGVPYTADWYSCNHFKTPTGHNTGLAMNVYTPPLRPIYALGATGVKVTATFSSSDTPFDYNVFGYSGRCEGLGQTPQYGIRTSTFSCYYPDGIDNGALVTMPASSKYSVDMTVCWNVGAPPGQWMLQTDPRWADQYVGRSTASFRYYGGEITALAMALYFVDAINLTPDQINASLLSCPDGFLGSRGLTINYNAVKRYFGVKSPVGYSLDQLYQMPDAQVGIMAGYQRGVSQGWLVPTSYVYQHGQFSHLTCDPLGVTTSDEALGPPADVKAFIWRGSPMAGDATDYSTFSVYPASVDSPITGMVLTHNGTPSGVMQGLQYGDLTDQVLQVSSLPAGHYALTITGPPNTQVTAKAFESGDSTRRSTASIISGTTDASGTLTYEFDHATSIPTPTPVANVAAIGSMANGSLVSLATINVLARTEDTTTWSYYVQDGMLPHKIVANRQLAEFTPITNITGTVTNGLLSCSSLTQATGSITCSPVLRLKAIDKAAGAVYTKTVGRVVSVTTGQAVLDTGFVISKAGYDFSPYQDRMIVACGSVVSGKLQVATIEGS